MAPVDRIIFHHEGAGAPTDNTARPLHERYSIAIGVSVYQMANTPSRSFRTTGTTGPSLQIVFTGNREVFAVTSSDLRLVERAVTDAKRMAWVTQDPTVQFHGDTDNTGCPGRNVKARRADLERICGPRPGIIVPVPPVEEEDELVKAITFARDTRNGAVYLVWGTMWKRHIASPAELAELQAHWKARGADTTVYDWTYSTLDAIPVAA